MCFFLSIIRIIFPRIVTFFLRILSIIISVIDNNLWNFLYYTYQCGCFRHLHNISKILHVVPNICIFYFWQCENVLHLLQFNLFICEKYNYMDIQFSLTTILYTSMFVFLMNSHDIFRSSKFLAQKDLTRYGFFDAIGSLIKFRFGVNGPWRIPDVEVLAQSVHAH